MVFVIIVLFFHALRVKIHGHLFRFDNPQFLPT
jgi:hypothetical protein